MEKISLFIIAADENSREALIARLSDYNLTEICSDKINLEQDETDKDLENTVVELLYIFGITPNLLGFDYLKYGIIQILHGDRKKGLTTELYPAIAARYTTTASKVERSIRHAIKRSWDHGYLGLDFDKRPANSTFIYFVVQEIKKNN